MLRISEFGGETAIIGLIAAEYGAREGGDLVLGIGDDAALVRVSGDRLLIVTTDLLIEDTHFRRDIIDAYSLGWKSVAANISDIAAMGGTPSYTFASIALDDVDVSYLKLLYEGMRDCAETFGSRIAGGDTNTSKDQWALNITQLGIVSPRRVALRSGVQPGDSLLVTGSLGDSKAGLELLLRYGLEEAQSMNPAAVEAHLRPRPRVNEAIAAAGTGWLHAMMDISDGLAADLPKLCAASNAGAVVRAQDIPVSQALESAAQELQQDTVDLALQGGEDYELLIAVAEADVDVVTDAVMGATGIKFSLIGNITPDGDVLVEWLDGKQTPLRGGWEHFTQG